MNGQTSVLAHLIIAEIQRATLHERCNEVLASPQMSGLQVPTEKDTRNRGGGEFSVVAPAFVCQIRTEVHEGPERNEITRTDVSTCVTAVPRTVTVHNLDVDRVAKITRCYGPEARKEARTL